MQAQFAFPDRIGDVENQFTGFPIGQAAVSGHGIRQATTQVTVQCFQGMGTLDQGRKSRVLQSAKRCLFGFCRFICAHKYIL